MEESKDKCSFISRVIESDVPIRIHNPLLSSIVKFGLIPDMLFILFWALRADQISNDYLIGYILAIVWINIGPWILWYYERKHLIQFFKNCEHIVAEHNFINDLKERSIKRYQKNFYLVFTFFLIVDYSIYLTGSLFCTDQYLVGSGITTLFDPFFIIYTCAIGWIAYLISSGVTDVIETQQIVYEISHKEINIDPLHPDEVGGMFCIGKFAIGTTILAATAALFFPWLFQIAKSIPPIALAIYCFVSIYPILIAISFIYPTAQVNRTAHRIRWEKLETLGNQFKQKSAEIGENHSDPIQKLISFNELSKIKNTYNEYRNLRLYPFKIDIAMKLIMSILFPVTLIVLKIYLGKML
ncbi:hypothetical protein [Methanofollis fontis]|uniref:Uncharacterized protein n=1 Tax=Methanofollis fontis TaxID=2052832 RepID=A0A483CWZ2_9EURY|nr:hypothetical protein [Methanofollis fontis]TAJ45800.1 hypothetical protein CUJ86_03575 [Methanofollis fontis]